MLNHHRETRKVSFFVYPVIAKSFLRVEGGEKIARIRCLLFLRPKNAHARLEATSVDMDMDGHERVTRTKVSIRTYFFLEKVIRVTNASLVRPAVIKTPLSPSCKWVELFCLDSI